MATVRQAYTHRYLYMHNVSIKHINSLHNIILNKLYCKWRMSCKPCRTLSDYNIFWENIILTVLYYFPQTLRITVSLYFPRDNIGNTALSETKIYFTQDVTSGTGRNLMFSVKTNTHWRIYSMYAYILDKDILNYW